MVVIPTALTAPGGLSEGSGLSRLHVHYQHSQLSVKVTVKLRQNKLFPRFFSSSVLHQFFRRDPLAPEWMAWVNQQWKDHR